MALNARKRQRLDALLSRLPLIDGDWRYSRPLCGDDPRQGWKLHVSATVLSAGEVLARAGPLLRKRGVLYKVPVSPDRLLAINSGLVAFSQVGKFLTVYARTDEEAVELAHQLHTATRGLPGPQVPFDARYSTGSRVHYRYGSFHPSGKIRHPSGKLIPDIRGHGKAIPSWITNPFPQARRKLPRVKGPIGRDLLVYRAKMQRGKGGVYEALDLSITPPRLVILKEGRRHGETDWSGRDGYDRVRHEARVLRALHRKGLPVPRLYREFTQNGHRYLTLERIVGRPLIAANRQQPGSFSWRRAEKILCDLEGLLSRIHAAGWVWRDCKPSHVLIHWNRMRVIDFEDACRMGETTKATWFSSDYAPRTKPSRRSLRHATREDDYALGVIAFQFLGGRFPPARADDRRKIYRRAKCPSQLSRQIEQLLAS